MKIILTGGSGMVGRNLLAHPGIAGFEVLAPGRSELDLLRPDLVAQYFRVHRPEVVIHCAGMVGGIQANINSPVSFLINNLDIGRNVILAAQMAGVKKLINLGSSCMYPRDGANPLREDLILKGELEPTNEGYALAKIVVARLCEYVGQENPYFQYKTLIPCNLYGPWDKFDPARSHLIPAVIHKVHDAMIRGKTEVVIWGDGQARREFMYVGDLADCLVRAIHYFDQLPSTMNVGLGNDFTINEYYQYIAEVVGYQGHFVHDLDRPVGMKQKVVDVSRQRDWGWDTRTSLADGLFKTYQFYLEQMSGI